MPTTYSQKKSPQLLAIEEVLLQLWQEVLPSEKSLFLELDLSQLDSIQQDEFLAKFKVAFPAISFPKKDYATTQSLEFLARYIRRSELIKEQRENEVLYPVISTLTPAAKAYNKEDKKPVIFCLHPVFGDAKNSYSEYAQHFSDNVLFGLASWGLSEGGLLSTDLQELANSYLELIQSIQPKGPYVLVGWSFGGILIREIEKLLDKNQQVIPILLNTICPQTLIDMPREDFANYIKTKISSYWPYLLKEYELTHLPAPELKTPDILEASTVEEDRANIIDDVFNTVLKLIDDIPEQELKGNEVHLRRRIELTKLNLIAQTIYPKSQLTDKDLLLVSSQLNLDGFTSAQKANAGWDNHKRIQKIEGNDLAVVRSWGGSGFNEVIELFKNTITEVEQILASKSTLSSAISKTFFGATIPAANSNPVIPPSSQGNVQSL